MAKRIGSVATPFSQRENRGRIVETLNGFIKKDAKTEVLSENRCKLSLNVDNKKYSFRTMHQKLMEASDGIL